ncbi:tyrosine-type recombinase/integrase [Paraburkholderia sp. SIMBA_030]|uniref:tyrosine-type recombinase/integrase n=1 Tax=Paraburkholderia sp. SIMBA_030 TaxID=3085773 RepID=UPI00397D05A1
MRQRLGMVTSRRLPILARPERHAEMQCTGSTPSRRGEPCNGSCQASVEFCHEIFNNIAHVAAVRTSRTAVSRWSIVAGCPHADIRMRTLQYRFRVAREAAGIAAGDFQFRDLRAKTGTVKTETTGDIRQAQKQLGHGSVVTTEHYVRKRRGDKVGPTR